jgi:hypothetical protein
MGPLVQQEWRLTLLYAALQQYSGSGTAEEARAAVPRTG